jgi:hypothetical protein
MCQLLAWRKRLTDTDPRPCALYRISPHCSRDKRLVAKWVDKVEPSSLDPRGLFVLFCRRPSKLFIWVGADCKHVQEYLVAAHKLIQRLQLCEHAPNEVIVLHPSSNQSELYPEPLPITNAYGPGATVTVDGYNPLEGMRCVVCVYACPIVL